MMNIVAESAAARGVKQLIERHMIVLEIQCAALRRPVSKQKARQNVTNAVFTLV